MSAPLVLETAGAGCTLDIAIGTVRGLWFDTEGPRIDPLHTAPWGSEPGIDALNLPPVERALAGDFLCAPFGQDETGDAPIHGWAANAPWKVEEITRSGRRAGAVLTLTRNVMGATITKELMLSAGVPMLSQVHRVTGGQGGLTLAHHPMVHMAAGGWLSYSPKRAALAPDVPLDPGHNLLKSSARSTDLSAVAATAGGTIDLHRYPEKTGHEDFVTLVEAPAAGPAPWLGWTAVIREAEDDLIFVLKDPAVLPVTMLWISNGGRKHAPWNGRHTGVLGIEDGIAAGAAGQIAARGPNTISAEGVPTVLPLAEGREHIIRHVIGAIPRPKGWTRIVSIEVTGTGLTIREAGGQAVMLDAPREMLPV
ncbi:MAG: hypothetical protein ACRCSU_10620 [Paracoccaceae bacterium]